MTKDQGQSEFDRLTRAQAQAERSAGQVVTLWVRERGAQERMRLLALVIHLAGQATAYESEAQAIGDAIADRARGPRR